MVLRTIDIQKTLNIPVGVSKWVVINNFARPFQVFLLLKANCSGTVFLDTHSKNLIANHLKVSTKTVDRAIQRLIDINWIGYDTRTGKYYVRSFELIQEYIGDDSRKCSLFHLDEIYKIKGFVFSSVLAYKINQRKHYQRSVISKKSLGVINRENTLQRLRSANTPDNPYKDIFRSGNLPVREIGKVFGKSNSVIHNYKLEAEKAGYISICHRFYNTGISARFLNTYKRVNEEIAHKTVAKGGVIKIILCDDISHNIKIKRKHK
jgi:hypothetical protein